MKINLLALSALCWLVGCTIPDANMTLPLDAGNEVFDFSGVDFSIAAGSIGAPCQDNTACTAGKMPVCWKKNILDDPGNLPTPNGYCSSQCSSDADCGGTGTCQTVLAGVGKYCLRTCQVPNTCRNNDGYACFLMSATLGYCYPSTRLTCNPTLIDPATKNGTCPGANPASACIRRTFEDLGECRPLCSAGVGQCAASGGLPQHCVYIDTTKDSKGRTTRDTFKGLGCFPVYPDAKKPGESCNYFDECTDGYECNVVQAGDFKCHALCTVGVANGCSAPETCKDAFGAGAGSPGLCLP